MTITIALGANIKHFIESLPQIPKELMRSKWYSGYYQVATHKQLHYLFIESLNNPETDPVMVTFNGGPGGPSIELAFQGFGPVIADESSGKI